MRMFELGVLAFYEIWAHAFGKSFCSSVGLGVTLVCFFVFPCLVFYHKNV
jgi:hypothetical protein